MSEPYDLVVIGSGVAAQSAAATVRKAGWRVAVIDHRPFGGTCQLRGCDPKKVLVHAEAMLDGAHRLHGLGLEGQLYIDWPALIHFKRSFTDPVPEQQEKSFRDRGIDAFHGLARFAGPDAVAVEDRTLPARHVLIAAGADPVRLGIPGEQHVVTSDDFLALPALPGRIVLIGGGYIAAEFSLLAARAGAGVTVLQRAPRLLPHFDPDLVGWLMPVFAEAGVDVRTNARVTAVEQDGRSLLVRAATPAGEQTVTADLVVHAAGRVPNLEALDPAAGELRLEHGRLALNPFLQSVSNPRVYAAGDVAGSGPPLTPVASHDASVAAANLLHGNQRRPDYRGVPSVAFTVPPIAAVGLSEQQASDQGLRVRVQAEQVSDWYSARHRNAPVYGFKTLVEEGSGRILGAHLVGPRADEVINLFALAIRHGLTAEALQATMFAYPTDASDIASMV